MAHSHPHPHKKLSKSLLIETRPRSDTPVKMQIPRNLIGQFEQMEQPEDATESKQSAIIKKTKSINNTQQSFQTTQKTNAYTKDNNSSNQRSSIELTDLSEGKS